MRAVCAPDGAVVHKIVGSHGFGVLTERIGIIRSILHYQFFFITFFYSEHSVFTSK